MNNKLTEADIKEMEDELHYRIVERRHKLLEEVKRTREYGDLSENAEYKCAKQAQNKNERRIRYLTGMINTAEVITEFAKGDEIGLYSRVKLHFTEDDEDDEILLVSTVKIDIDENYISLESPLGKALAGKHTGDKVTVTVDENNSYEVVVTAVEQTAPPKAKSSRQTGSR